MGPKNENKKTFTHTHTHTVYNILVYQYVLRVHKVESILKFNVMEAKIYMAQFVL